MTVRLIAGASPPPDGRYDVDILILALDRVPETLAAIGSALAQTGVRAHVFVLDQGSRPGALQLLAEAVGDRQDITLLAVEDNLGVAGWAQPDIGTGSRPGHCRAG